MLMLVCVCVCDVIYVVLLIAVTCCTARSRITHAHEQESALIVNFILHSFLLIKIKNATPRTIGWTLVFYQNLQNLTTFPVPENMANEPIHQCLWQMMRPKCSGNGQD